MVYKNMSYTSCETRNRIPITNSIESTYVDLGVTLIFLLIECEVVTHGSRIIV